MIKIYLDDVRATPDDTWVRTYTATETIKLIARYNGKEPIFVSLDHDLGGDGVTAEGEDGKSGYDVAVFIEEAAYSGTLQPLLWAVHSANPAGAERMRAALRNADKYWLRGK